MPWLKYKYSCQLDISSSKCRCLWPIIEIEVSSNDKKLTVMALIDSGATTTNMDSDIARYLGIDLDKCTIIKNKGVNSVSDGRLSRANLKIKDMGNKFDSPVIFMEKLPCAVLLGQDNFFDNFDVKFEKRNGTFELKRF
jgi:hypothetical protein